MKKLALGVLCVLVAVSVWQALATAQAGAPPNIAFDITKADIDLILKDAFADSQGKLAIPTNDKAGDPISMIYHDYTAETYIITSGSGILTTGGTILNKKASAGVNVMNGPSGNGTAGANAYSRKVQTGDIIIIPTGVGHGWSQITDHVTYLSVRPDPDRVLPAGYVYPLLLKNLPAPVK